MSISILYPKDCSTGNVGEKTLYHLSLDRAVGYITADVEKQACFLDVLSHPLQNEDDIAFRREILHDLVENPTLAEELTSLFDRFCALRDSHRETERQARNISLTRNQSLESCRNVLESNALDAKRALLFVKAIADVLAPLPLHAAGWQNLLSRAQSIADAPSFSELIRLCAAHESIGSWESGAVRIGLSSEGKIVTAERLEAARIRDLASQSIVTEKGFSLFKRPKPAEYPTAPIQYRHDGLAEKLFSHSYKSLSDLFSHTADQLFAEFCHIRDELKFYTVALDYIAFLKSKKIPSAYLSTAPEITLTSAHDLLLLALLPEGTVRPIQISTEDGRLIITGDNGSGKTVLLRTAGTAILLNQAGLPVAAEGQLPLIGNLYTQFSESEKPGIDRAGRFEQEARDLSTILHSTKPRDLLLLNEIFQSTAYQEAAQGLTPILHHLHRTNVLYLSVTHLPLSGVGKVVKMKKVREGEEERESGCEE